MQLGRDQRTDVNALRAYRRAGPIADLAVLISDAMVAPESLAGALDELVSAARSVVLVHMFGPVEQVPYMRGALELRDRETGERLELRLTDLDLRRIWAALRALPRGGR